MQKYQNRIEYNVRFEVNSPLQKLISYFWGSGADGSAEKIHLALAAHPERYSLYWFRYGIIELFILCLLIFLGKSVSGSFQLEAGDFTHGPEYEST